MSSLLFGLVATFGTSIIWNSLSSILLLRKIGIDTIPVWESPDLP